MVNKRVTNLVTPPPWVITNRITYTNIVGVMLPVKFVKGTLNAYFFINIFLRWNSLEVGAAREEI